MKKKMQLELQRKGLLSDYNGGTSKEQVFDN